MSSIIGEKKFRNATDSGGWAVSDKIFTDLDKLGNIYNKIRYPQTPVPGDPNYAEYQAWLAQQQSGMFGLPRPFGFILLAGGVGLIAFIIYKAVK